MQKAALVIGASRGLGKCDRSTIFKNPEEVSKNCI